MEWYVPEESNEFEFACKTNVGFKYLLKSIASLEKFCILLYIKVAAAARTTVAMCYIPGCGLFSRSSFEHPVAICIELKLSTSK